MRNRVIYPSYSLVLLLLLAIVVFSPLSANGAVTAKVDRDTVAIDETLTLTISKDESDFFSKPDTKKLEKDFQVVGTSQSSNMQYINGKMSSTVKWELVLSPRRIGKLQIPPFDIGGEKTEPIWVLVEKGAPPKKSTDKEATIFIETEVDHDEVTVQSQLIYTIKVYFSVQAQIQDPPAPELSDVLLEKLEDATFDKSLNGKNYKVFERRYAIFPQKSGILEIPQEVIQITVPSRRRFGSVFDMLDQGQTYQLRANGHTVMVREKSPDFPEDSVWLPSLKFSLSEKWSSDPELLKVGESATLSIDIFGAGLLGAQLPPIVLPEIDGIKMYQNKAEIENNKSKRGIVGHRTETIALIPTQPGSFIIPEIRVPWWDKKNSEVKYAAIPRRVLKVTGAAAEVKTPGPVTVDKSNTFPEVEKGVDLPGKNKEQYSGWKFATIVLAILLLTTFLLLIHTRRKLAGSGIDFDTDFKRNTTDALENEKKTYSILLNSCKTGDLNRVHRDALNWADSYFTEKSIRTTSDLYRIDPDCKLANQLQLLESYLYGKEPVAKTWDTQGVVDAVNALRKNKTGVKKGGYLTPLYKYSHALFIPRQDNP